MYYYIRVKEEHREREVIKMKRFEVVIAGTVDSKFETREDALRRLNEIKNSFYALVHPIGCMFIREAKG